MDFDKRIANNLLILYKIFMPLNLFLCFTYILNESL